MPRKRKNLAGQVVEVQERVDRYGKILVSPDYEKIAKIAAQLVEGGNKCAVVSFLHAAKNTEHETQVAKVLSDAGFQKVIISSSISNFPKWLPRLESAVIEAYLSDVLDQYLDRVDDSWSREPGLWVMGSSGGLQKRKSYRAIDSLLSGPARRSGWCRCLLQDRLALIILSIWTWVEPVQMYQGTLVVTVTSLLIRWVMLGFPAFR